MQIASQETPGGVKEELAGRRREANECSGKCIQGEGCWWGGGALLFSYSYQLIQSYQWGRVLYEEGTRDPRPGVAGPPHPLPSSPTRFRPWTPSL